jgi:hypothetical protein
MVAIEYLYLASCPFVPGRLSKKHGEITRLLVRTYLPCKWVRLRSPIPYRPQNQTQSPHSPESIECFIECQVLARAYDSTPRPPPPASPFSNLSLFLRSSLLTGEGGGR